MRRLIVLVLILACITLALLSPRAQPEVVMAQGGAWKESTPGLLGYCHGVTMLGDPRVSWVYPSGGPVLWRNVETSDNVFDWAALDAYVDQVETAGKKIWIQVQSSEPGVPTVPEWAVNMGVKLLPNCFSSNINCDNYDYSKALQWDAVYHEQWEEVVAAMAERYDSEPAVEAVLIMAGGNYGEMSQTVAVCYGTQGYTPDVWDPNSVFIQKMAEVTGDSIYNLTHSYTGPDGRAWVAKFDYYYVENTKRLIDMYMRHFYQTPIVVQLGSGVSCQASVAGAVADYAAETYGKRVWLKQNGWGNAFGHPYYGYAYDSILGDHSNDTRVIYEGGFPANWCDKYNAQMTPIASNCNLISTATPPSAWAHNGRTLYNSIVNAKISAACLQEEFFNQPSKYPLVTPTNVFINALLQNYNTYYLPIATPVLATVTPTATGPTPTPSNTPLNTSTPTSTNTGTPTATGPTPTKTVTPTTVGTALSYQQGVSGYTGAEDTFINSGSPAGKYGSSSTLYLYNDDRFRSLMRFELEGLPAGSTINRAELRFTISYLSQSSLQVYVRRLLRDVDYANATWNTYDGTNVWGTAGAKASTDISSVAYVTDTLTAGLEMLDVKTLVQYWSDHPDSNYGLLIDPYGGVSTQANILSAETASTSSRPKLYIEYTAPAATQTPTHTHTPTVTATPTATRITAATVVWTPVYDTQISGAAPDLNYLTGTTLNVSGQGTMKSLFYFDTAGIAESDVISATLYVYFYTSANVTPVPVGVVRLSKDLVWAQTTWNKASNEPHLPWETPGAEGPGDIGPDEWSQATLDTQEEWYTWDVTDLFQAWVNGTWENQGLALQLFGDVVTGGLWWRAYSNNYTTDPGLRPYLEIGYLTATPTITPTPTETGTPTATASGTPRAQALINEALPQPVAAQDFAGTGVITDSSFIEIYNSTDAAIDMTWSRLVVSDTALITYTIPYSSLLPAGGYLVVYYEQSKLPLLMKTGSGEVRLYTWEHDVDAGWGLVLTDTLAIPMAVTPGSSRGRYEDGAESILWREWPSPGQSNALPTPTATATVTATPT